MSWKFHGDYGDASDKVGCSAIIPILFILGAIAVGLESILKGMGIL
jgi:hypothetical protein